MADFYSGFSLLTSNNTFTSSDFNFAGFVGSNTIAIWDKYTAGTEKHKIHFISVDEEYNITYQGSSSPVVSHNGAIICFYSNRIIAAAYPSKIIYSHSIENNSITSTSSYTISNSNIRYPSPGLNNAGIVRLRNGYFLMVCEDLNYNYVFLSLSEDGLSVQEHEKSGLIIPLNNYFSYPDRICSCSVGENKSILCARIYDLTYIDKMVFIASKVVSGSITKTEIIQCPDLDGEPISVASNGNSFCLMYVLGYEIKFIYGEIDDSLNITFSVPFSLGLSSTIYRTGSIAYEGNNNYTFCCSYNNGMDRILISSLYIDNFEITFSETKYTRINGCRLINSSVYIGNSVFDRNFFITYGTGTSPLTLNGKLYYFTTSEEEEIPGDFWTNRIVHKEDLFGMLTKQQTLSVIPSRPGQPYIPARPAVPAKTTYYRLYQRVCIKVG